MQPVQQIGVVRLRYLLFLLRQERFIELAA
jgi:hypothetical protein